MTTLIDAVTALTVHTGIADLDEGPAKARDTPLFAHHMAWPASASGEDGSCKGQSGVDD
jgi:hypothetical protein